MKEIDLALEYFKSLRAEIDLRIKSQTYLTISKVLACATLAGFLLDLNPHGTAYLALPILAFSLDLLIFHNLIGINTIGKYIRDELEKKSFTKIVHSDLVLYEQFAQSERTGLRDLILDRFGQVLITTLFSLLAIIIPVDQGIEISIAIVVIVIIDAMVAWRSTASS